MSKVLSISQFIQEKAVYSVVHILIYTCIIAYNINLLNLESTI